MAAPNYKLTYFPIRAMAEPIRYMFAAAGVSYEDDRIARENWPGTLKANTPFGQMPVLEFGGRQYCQSKAICRFLGSKFNICPATDEERLKADMIGDCCEDMRGLVVGAIRAKRADNIQLMKEFGEKFNNDLPSHLQNFDRFLAQNESSDKYFVGSKLTWVDIYFVAIMEFYTDVGKQFGQWEVRLDQYPKLQAHRDNVLANKGIAAWRQKRPVTDV